MSYGGSGELTQSDECYERYSTRLTRPHQVTYSQITVDWINQIGCTVEMSDESSVVIISTYRQKELEYRGTF